MLQVSGYRNSSTQRHQVIYLNNVGSEAVQGDVEYMFPNHNSLLRNTHSAIKYFSWQSIFKSCKYFNTVRGRLQWKITYA